MRLSPEVRQRLKTVQSVIGGNYFSLVHSSPASHLEPSLIGDTTLSDETFFSDMRSGAEKYFAEIDSDVQLQDEMLKRLKDIQQGGTISVMNVSKP